MRTGREWLMGRALAVLAGVILVASTASASAFWTVRVIKVADPLDEGYAAEFWINGVLDSTDTGFLVGGFVDYSIELFDGDLIEVDLTSLGSADYDLELYDESSILVDSSTESRIGDLDSLGGTYIPSAFWTVTVIKSSDPSAEGYYVEFWINGVLDSTDTAVLAGASFDYTIEVFDGDTLDVYLTSLGSFADYDLELYDEFGDLADFSYEVPIDEPDSLGGSYIPSAFWTVRVIKSSDPSNEGYFIEFWINGVLDFTDSGFLAGASFDYTIEVFDGDTVDVYLTSLGSSADYDLELYDEFSRLVDFSDEPPATEPDIIGGTYVPSAFWTVRVVKSSDPSDEGYFIEFWINGVLDSTDTAFLVGGFFDYSIEVFDGDTVDVYLTSLGSSADYDLELYDEFSRLADFSYEVPINVPDYVSGAYAIPPPPGGDGGGGCSPSRLGRSAATFAWLLPLACAAAALRRKRAGA